MKGLTTGYLPQDGLTLSGRSVFEECMTVFDELRDMEKEQEALAHKMSEIDPSSPEYAQISERFHRIQSEFHNRDGYSLESQVGAVLAGLGFPPEDWARRTEEFSGGWQMRIALAKLLLAKPDILLLDEPTNHLDLEARNWLEEYLNSYPNAFVLISHDRYFLDVTVKKIAELWNKRVTFYTGGFSKFEELKTERLAQLRAAFNNQRDRIEQLEAFINRFRAQATKAKQVQSRIKELEKIDRIEIPPEEKTIHFRFPQPKPSGRIVAEFKNVSKSYGAKHVFSGANFVIERGDRIALVGVNGAGKSTLIKILAGAEPGSDIGRVHAGAQRPTRLLRAGSIQGAQPELEHPRRHRDGGAAGDEHRAARRARLLPVLRSRRGQAHWGAVGRRAQPVRAGADADDAVEIPAARLADESPGHASQGCAVECAAGVPWHGGVRVARPVFSGQAGHAGD